MGENISRKTLTDNNRALVKIIIALLRPHSETAGEVIAMKRPTRLIEEIWLEARMAIELARRFQSGVPGAKPARTR